MTVFPEIECKLNSYNLDALEHVAIVYVRNDANLNKDLSIVGPRKNKGHSILVTYFTDVTV